MCTYLKNMARWKPKDLKSKSFANIQELFDKAFKRVNTFVDFRTELWIGHDVNGRRIKWKSEKGVDDASRQQTKIKELMKMIPYYEIIRVDGSSKRYSAFIQMLRSFNREDLETLWKLFKAKHGYTRPEEGYKRVLWGDLMTMFQSLHVCMLVEKKISSLSPAIITKDAEIRTGKLIIGMKYGRIVEIKRLLNDLRVTAAKFCVTTAKQKLVLIINFNEKYAKCTGRVNG
ncbi:hypothetical protein Tco_0127381 [Tanacetum coccineum]